MGPLIGDLVFAGLSQAFSADSCDILSGATSQAGSLHAGRWPGHCQSCIVGPRWMSAEGMEGLQSECEGGRRS